MVKPINTPHGERVRADILRTGLELWRTGGGEAVSARAIGRVLGLTHAGTLYHFGNVAALKQAIAAQAIQERDAVIVPQLIVVGHPAAAALSADERAGYLTNL